MADQRADLARIVRSLTLARIASGMTQKDLAERLEVTQVDGGELGVGTTDTYFAAALGVG